MFLALKELRKDTKEGWKKLVVPLEEIITVNNAMNVRLKKKDVQLTRREDIMNRWVTGSCVKIDVLQMKVTLGILGALADYLHPSSRLSGWRSS